MSQNTKYRKNKQISSCILMIQSLRQERIIHQEQMTAISKKVEEEAATNQANYQQLMNTILDMHKSIKDDISKLKDTIATKNGEENAKSKNRGGTFSQIKHLFSFFSSKREEQKQSLIDEQGYDEKKNK